MAETIRFYLETSERSMETHARRMPEVTLVTVDHMVSDTSTPPDIEWEEYPTTACGVTPNLTWAAYPKERAKKQPWPTCAHCYTAVTERGWWPHNLEEENHG